LQYIARLEQVAGIRRRLYACRRVCVRRRRLARRRFRAGWRCAAGEATDAEKTHPPELHILEGSQHF
jgi:hypothetical protein